MLTFSHYLNYYSTNSLVGSILTVLIIFCTYLFYTKTIYVSKVNHTTNL